MKLSPEQITKLSPQQFRRFGIACCHRLGCANKDKRLAKALRKLEQAVEQNNEQLRRDALNAANSIYHDIFEHSKVLTVSAAIACTLVCACSDGPNLNLLGNFHFALSTRERLTSAEIEKITYSLFKQIERS